MGHLTDRQVRNAAPGRHGDGDGLYLLVTANGRRSWMLRFQLAGARRDMGLGPYPAIGLGEARIAAADARKLIASGTDPLNARRKRTGSIPKFSDIAALVIAEAQEKSVNAKVRYQWERHLGHAYCGRLVDRPINEITTSDVADQLRPIWRAKPEVARKVYPAIRRVFEYARVRLRDEYGVTLERNPANWDDLKALGFEAPRQLSRGRHPSLDYRQLPQFMADLRAREAVSARALEFLILTNVRTDAVLKARWGEIDLSQAIWTVPLASLKDREHRQEPFRVPLSPRAVEIVKNLAKAQTTDLIFPGAKFGRPLSNMALLTLLKRMNHGDEPRWIDPISKRPITAHGFRATFRTWAEETTASPHAVIEQAMGHQVGTAVERAYRRTDVLEKRRDLMKVWESFSSPMDRNSATDC